MAQQTLLYDAAAMQPDRGHSYRGLAEHLRVYPVVKRAKPPRWSGGRAPYFTAFGKGKSLSGVAEPGANLDSSARGEWRGIHATSIPTQIGGLSCSSPPAFEPAFANVSGLPPL